MILTAAEYQALYRNPEDYPLGIVLEMVLREQTSTFYGQNLDLTLQEYNFLTALASHPLQTVEYHILLNESYNEEYYKNDFARDDFRERAIPCRSKIMREIKQAYKIYSEAKLKNLNEQLSFLEQKGATNTNELKDEIKKLSEEMKTIHKELITHTPSNAGYNEGYRLNLPKDKILIVRA